MFACVKLTVLLTPFSLLLFFSLQEVADLVVCALVADAIAAFLQAKESRAL